MMIVPVIIIIRSFKEVKIMSSRANWESFILPENVHLCPLFLACPPCRAWRLQAPGTHWVPTRTYVDASLRRQGAEYGANEAPRIHDFLIPGLQNIFCRTGKFNKCWIPNVSFVFSFFLFEAELVFQPSQLLLHPEWKPAQPDRSLDPLQQF